MKKMKKTIFIAVIVSLFSVATTHAQDAPSAPKEKNKKEFPGRRGGSGGMGMMGMYKDLNLTKDQEEKIKAVNEAQKTKVQEIRNDNSLSQKARRDKMMELRKERTGKINTILTKEQKEKLKAKMKERRGKRFGNPDDK